MNLIDIIPVGKEHKKTRQELMYETKMTDEVQFKKEMAELKKKHIILFDDGYYLPASKEEYVRFIKKINANIGDAINTLELAYGEMEEFKNV